MNKSIAKALADMEQHKDRWRKDIVAAREMILANLSMIAEAPAPTFEEKDRAEFILNRFAESGIPEPLTDEMHNVIGLVNPKTGHDRTIVIFTHMDNAFGREIDQNIRITENRVYGAGVADDNLSLAVLLTLPDIFKSLACSFKSNLILLATTRFHGRGDSGGMRHFIATMKKKQGIDAMIDLNGTSLGTINYLSQSRVRGDIVIDTSLAAFENPRRIPESSAIQVANQIMDQLFQIPLPRKPKTTLNIGMISGGERYSTLSRNAELHFEALSDDDVMMESLIEQINTMCTDIGAQYNADVQVSFFGRKKVAALTSAHPLVKASMAVIRDLGFKPQIHFANSEVAASLSEAIPSVSIGISEGEGGSSPKSYVEIDPIMTGVLQLIMLLKLIDY